MKIGLPQGWFARIMLGGWALLLVGTLLVFLLGFLSPGTWVGHLIKAIWIVSIFVVLGTFAYAVVYTFNRLNYYWQNRRTELPHRWFARILLGGWILFFIGALLIFLAPRTVAQNLINPLLVLTIFVMLGSLAYVYDYAGGRLYQGLRRVWQRKSE
jgi:hypothetical protein